VSITTKERLPQIVQTRRGELSRILGSQLEAVHPFGSRVRSEEQTDSIVHVLLVVCGGFDCGDIIPRTSAVVLSLSPQYDVVISRAFVSKEPFEQEQRPLLWSFRRKGVAV
jgi:predicted nucleotidyltransferase